MRIKANKSNIHSSNRKKILLDCPMYHRIDAFFRVKTLEDALAAAKKEHESIYEIKEMLRRHNDNLKNQHDW